MNNKENSKAKIIDTALTLFAEEGYNKTPISRIAKEAGISQGLMYNYFRSKEELLEEIISAGFSQIRLSLQIHSVGISPSEIIKKHIELRFRLAEENKSFWRMYYGLRMQNAVPAKMEDKIKEVNDLIHKTLEESFKKSGAKNPDTEALVLSAMIDGVIIHYLLKENTFKLEEVKNNIIKKYTF